LKHNSFDTSKYFALRLTEDNRRETTWKALCDYFFNRIIGNDEVVLEVGAGYCDFINNANGRKKIALDHWEEFKRYAGRDVETHVADALDLAKVINCKVDTILCSNLLEHLSKDEILELLGAMKLILSPINGKLIIVQPNFRLNPNRYFDDYTHVSIWSDVSLKDFLNSHGFKVIRVLPKFLPLSLKSKMPVSRRLIWLYLKLPFKYKAGQMLLIAELDSPNII